MTKKIFLGMSAMAMLFATSCKDDFAESFVGDQATVEFSISTPEIGTRAFSEGKEVDHLHYAIYEKIGEGNNVTYQITQLVATGENVVPLKNGTATLNLPLKTRKDYQAIFWADDKEAPYSVTFGENGASMSVDYATDKTKSNDEKRDAFYSSVHINIEGNESKTVTLTRPFAQLNIGTSDYEAAEDANYIPTQSKVTVKKIYNTLNLATGTVSGEREVTFNYNAIPNIDTEDFPVTGYEYLAMNYLLVGTDQEVVDIEFGYKDASDAEHTRTVGSVPVQRNYRTNIYGKLLTSEVDVNVEIEPDFNDHQYNISTADELQEAIYDAVAEGSGTITLTDDIIANEIITIGTNTRSNVGAQIVINGNGKTLTSTAGRAINVSGVDGVTIQNLTIDAKGERAINIIQNATNVTIKDVTATAANYTVNVATSAPNAVVAIKNSNLTGLNVVNVASPGANVTVDGSTINCNDNNTTSGESYAALCLTKEAVGGKIIATNTDVNVPEGSDSTAGRNGAEDGEVTIDGSAEDVTVTVAVITYPGSNYYYGFQTLQAAIDFAKDGETITLIRDFETSETYTIEGKNITLDLNGKAITASTTDGFEVQTGAKLTICGEGEISTNGAPIRALGGEVVVENGTFTQTGTHNSTTSTYRYCVDSRDGGKITINGGTFNTGNGMFNINPQSSIIVNGGKFEYKNTSGGTRHFAYVSGDLTINDGEFKGVANASAGGCFFCGAAPTGNVTVNGGKFTSLWTSGSVNKIFEVYYGGSIQVTGGLFNTNGGIASFVEENTDAATKDAYPYKAK